MDKKSCIITGATGYIGSHVTKYLLSQGWNVSIISDPAFGYGNIEEIKSQITIFEYDKNILSLIEFFKQTNADVVFHLAAAVITNYAPEQIPMMIQSNVQFGTEILEAMRHCNTKLIVTTGSYWQNYNSDTYNPVDLYAATKEAFEKIVQLYVDAHGFRHINLRLFDVYGEDDKRPKLWNTLKKIAGTDNTIDVSPGEQYLDVTHISDVCTAYEAAYNLLKGDTSITNETYGVFTGNQYTLKELIQKFAKAIGRNIKVNFGGKQYKKREVMHPKSNYKQLPNWSAKISASEGFSLFA